MVLPAAPSKHPPSVYWYPTGLRTVSCDADCDKDSPTLYETQNSFGLLKGQCHATLEVAFVEHVVGLDGQNNEKVSGCFR